MRSLFAKVFLTHLITLLVALLTVGVLLSTALHSLYVQLTKRQLLAVAQDMATELAPVLNDPERAAEVDDLVRLMEASSRTRIRVVRSQEDEGPGAEQVSPGEADIARGLVLPCGEDMLVAQVSVPGNHGSLCVRASLATTVEATVSQLRRLILLAGGVAVLVSLLVALGLSERISGPLRSMRRLAGRMADGDFSHRLNIRSADEIGALGHSFDSLADSLQATLARLQTEQSRLRSILASVAEGIIAVNSAGKATLINPQAVSLLGIDQSETVEMSISGLGLPEGVTREFARCLEKSELCAVEFALENPHRDLVLQVAPVRSSEEERWGAVAVLRDVTEARHLDRMRRRFVSDASHEIRTPLTAIGGFAAAIADGTAATPEEQARSAALIVRDVGRLDRLVRDLLDLSRIESGIERSSRVEIDVRELVGEAVESLESQIRKRGLTVALDLPSDLPLVRAHPDRIRQVLVNLVSNAVRFNREDGQISLVARRGDGSIRVEVGDTGQGIPPEELPHCWERFHRADTSRSRQEGGTGLGLAIVRSIIEAHGGTVFARSVVGEGSTFGFTLPID